MRSTVATSMPNWPPPINASPETLSRTRRYFGAVVILCQRLAGHLGDFIGEVAFDFFDALTDLEADKGLDLTGAPKSLEAFSSTLPTWVSPSITKVWESSTVSS